VRIFLVYISLILGAVSASAQTSLIPQPKTILWSAGAWSIPTNSEICYHRNAARSARWLQKLVSPISHTKLQESSTCKNGTWSITLEPKLKSLGPEGYHLRVSTHGVKIASSTDVGLFYAIQTLRQLLPAEVELSQVSIKASLPFVEIKDSPAYSWRGSMLDVARSFYGVDYVKHHIDRMALFKLNRLHLHLTDDQGWRIEIKSYPNLTQHGGSSAVKGGSAGFYTQAQYKEIQKYASDRYVTVIPEIEMPGHIYAALASYPELNCANFENLSPRRATPPNLYDGIRVKWNSLCLEKPEVETFITKVLKEISQITDGPWIHIGGDEVEVPGYEKFVMSADKELRQLGKTPIGWEEILNAKVDANTIAQVWTDNAPASMNPKIISLCQNFYLDHSNTPDQGLPNDWCKHDGVSLEDLYGFTFKDPRNTLGIEAPLWTEFANNPAEADDRLWPRLTAAAEVAWTDESNRQIKDFRTRLGAFRKRMDLMGLQFFETPTVKWTRGPRSEAPRSVFFDFVP